MAVGCWLVMTATTMNVFAGKAKPPSEAELSAELGRSAPLWAELVAYLVAQHGMAQEWSSYSRKAGWSLRLKLRDRNIVYLSPLRGSFRASFALGDKAVKAALESGLPSSATKIIKEAKRYAEGTAVRIEVTARKDLEVVKKLVVTKLEH